jgi:hypothetical protein
MLANRVRSILPRIGLMVIVVLAVSAVPRMGHTQDQGNCSGLKHTTWLNISHRTNSPSSLSVQFFHPDGTYEYEATSKIHTIFSNCFPLVNGDIYQGRSGGRGTWRFAEDGTISVLSEEIMRDGNGNGMGRFLIKHIYTIVSDDVLTSTFSFIFTSFPKRDCSGLGFVDGSGQAIVDPHTDLFASGSEAQVGLSGTGVSEGIPLESDPVWSHVPAP